MQNWRKFSAVLGAISLRSSIRILPSGSPRLFVTQVARLFDLRGLRSQVADIGHVKKCVIMCHYEPPTVISRKTLLGISKFELRA